jgi:hypothetical protein
MLTVDMFLMNYRPSSGNENNYRAHLTMFFHHLTINSDVIFITYYEHNECDTRRHLGLYICRACLLVVQYVLNLKKIFVLSGRSWTISTIICKNYKYFAKKGN